MNCQLSDPCLGGEHNCRAPQTCIATSGSGQYKCVCMGGYIALPGSPNECVDLDECTMDINDCSDTEECVNTVGGYFCKCKEGTSKVAGACRERDECALGLHTCDENASCMVKS